ncbi:glycosyltransferase family 22 protein [Hortaea werneckii]|nr:glycosyltransferase family 22 protein [Hortaea werneckii]KAI7321195.1 glycosyltransferase family 22 protein [Hortaea werneckii]
MAPKKSTPGINDSPDHFTIWSVYFLLFAWRYANAVSLGTFFQPDEYFQALEPAWNLAFGPESGAWITWEWREGLRSSLHPVLFALFYKGADLASNILDLGPSDRADVLIRTPSLLQSAIAAAIDFFTWRLAHRIYGRHSRIAHATLLLTAVSPWQWFCSVRTFSNSLETALTVFALYCWPWEWYSGLDEKKSDSGSSGNTPINLNVSLFAAALACILRPTNVLVWMALTVMLFRYNTSKIQTLVVRAVACGIVVLIVSLVADTAFYGKLTFPPLNFLQFNVVQSLSTFYGVNRPDYYFTEALALMLTTALPFAVVGLWKGLRRPMAKDNEEDRACQLRHHLTWTILTMMLILTLITHKEVRFIYPLLPMLHVIAAKPMADFFHPLPVPASYLRCALLALMMIANLLIASYVGTTHQRGVIDVMHYLRRQQEARFLHASTGSQTNITVGFLMPCHSTPWRSHLVHPEISAWALTCEPPIDIPPDQRATYLDEADVFYKTSAEDWLRSNMASPDTIKRNALEASSETIQDDKLREWPEYLVFFDQLVPTLEQYLAGTQYTECWRGFNTHWHDDARRYGDVVVWCLRTPEDRGR